MHQPGTETATKKKTTPIMAVQRVRSSLLSNQTLIKQQAEVHRLPVTIPLAAVVERKCNSHCQFKHRRFPSRVISRKHRPAKNSRCGTGKGKLAGRMPRARILHMFESSIQVHSTTVNWRK